MYIKENKGTDIYIDLKKNEDADIYNALIYHTLHKILIGLNSFQKHSCERVYEKNRKKV